MPFTPFHWGTPLLLSEYLFKDKRIKTRVLLFTLLASSFPDIDGFLYILAVSIQGDTNLRLHGILHSFIGSLFAGIIVVILAWVYARLRDEPDCSRLEIGFYFVSPLVFHFFLDLLMYPDIQPYWPFSDYRNPYVITESGSYLYLLGLLTFLAYILVRLSKQFLFEDKK